MKFSRSLLLALLVLAPIVSFAGGYLVGVQEYQRGWQDGYKAGFEKGYDDGFTDGNATGYAVGFAQGNSTGFAIGNETGFKKGNETGYEQGYGEGWNIGYQEGYEDGYNAGYQDGYEKGYQDGWKAGYQKGYEDALKKPIVNSTEVKLSFVINVSTERNFHWKRWVNITNTSTGEGPGYIYLELDAWCNDGGEYSILLRVTIYVNTTHEQVTVEFINPESWGGSINLSARAEDGSHIGYKIYAYSAFTYTVTRALSEYDEPYVGLYFGLDL